MKKQNKIALSLATAIILSNNIYAKDTTSLDTITVTANKMEENIQHIPQSITVIDSAMIEEKGIQNINDVIKEIPNMSANNGESSGEEVNFRGLNVSLFTNNNPVVIYIDGVATTSRFGFNTALVNVERIEVLRGPQGTLYGKDAIGAVINIITQEPTNTTNGSVGFEYGSDNYKKASLSINTPIVKDKLYFGINGAMSSDDGWITNDYNGDEKASKDKDYSINTSLLYKINDKLSTKLILNKEKTNNYWNNRQSLLSDTNINDAKRDDAKHANYDVPTFEKNNISSQSFNISYKTDDFNIKSITTHRKSDFVSEHDGDFSNTTSYNGLKSFNKFDADIYTQEIRISNNKSENIRWVSGLYFDKENRTQEPYGVEFPNYNPSTYDFIGNYKMDSHSKIKNSTQAIFGQAIIPMYDKFELTLGGRLQKITKEMDLSMYYLPVNTTGTAFYTLKDKKTWNTFLPKIALAYKMNENYTPYISVSKGYMPGGYNFFASTGSIDDNSFEPQKSTNYEAGIKGLIEDISFSASIFRMDITDIHVYKNIGTGIYLSDNAKKAHSQGIEFDFNYFPSDELEISGAFGFLDAKYDDYDTGSTKFDGKKIEKTPSHTASLSIAYHHPSNYYGRFDIKNAGKVYFIDDVNKKFVKDDGYTTLNIKVGYKLNKFDIYAYVKNLTNEEYINQYATSNRRSSATFNDPRFVGAGLKYSF